MHTIILTISLRFLRRSISSRELFYQPFLSSTRIFGNFYFEMNVMVSEPETVLVFETLVRNSNLSVRRTSWLNLRTKETPNKRLRCTFTLKNVGLLDFFLKKSHLFNESSISWNCISWFWISAMLKIEIQTLGVSVCMYVKSVTVIHKI